MGLNLKSVNFKSILLMLSVIGPGIITSSVDNDAGGIATYSIAGAHFGYSLLWTLIPITLVLIIVQEMCARMGVVTGKGLSDLIRENFGLRLTFLIMIGLLITNMGNTMAEFAGIAASGEIFGISKYVTVPVSAVFVWLLIVKGTYGTVEKVFLGASAFYISYLLSGLLAHPQWSMLAREMIMPTISLNKDYILMLIGMVGTTIAPWMQFYLQSSVVEKGIRLENYGYSKIDVIVGSLVTDIVAFFIIATCAATLYAQGIRIETARDAALALFPLAGNYSALLFAFGLFNASLFAASILPLATAYYVCEGFGWDSGVDKTFSQAPQFYAIYSMLIAIGVIAVLIPDAPLVSIMVISQVINGILLPFILAFMLLLVNNKKLMGNYTNSKFYNVVSWSTAIILTILTVIMVISLMTGM